MLDTEIKDKQKTLTPEQRFELLTPENKAAVIRQIEFLIASQSSGQ